MYAPAYAHVIIERMKEVDSIIANPFAHGSLDLAGRYSEGKKLKAMGFDKAYVLPNSLKSALVPFFAGIKERIGLKGESRYLLLNKMIKDKTSYQRMSARYVALAYIDDKNVVDDKSLPAFDYPSLEVKKPSDALLERLNLSLDRPLLVLGCGANYRMLSSGQQSILPKLVLTLSAKAIVLSPLGHKKISQPPSSLLSTLKRLTKITLIITKTSVA